MDNGTKLKNFYRLDDGTLEVDTNAIVDTMDMIKDLLDEFREVVIKEAEKHWQIIYNDGTNEASLPDQKLDNEIEKLNRCEDVLHRLARDPAFIASMFKPIGD
jgi:flagellin-specific chaperone FliS